MSAATSGIALVPVSELVLTHDGSPPEIMRRRIAALTRHMLLMQGERRELKVEHEVVGGMYRRRLFIPKGTLLVGKIHLQTCLNVVESGDITVLTEIGIARLTAGATGFSAPGIQKVGQAHEDTVFTNVFRTDLTDIDEIEAAVATTVHGQFNEQVKELLCL